MTLAYDPPMLAETLTNFWIGAMLWSLLYISECAFRVACARLYEAGVKEKIASEGRDQTVPSVLSPRSLGLLLLNLVVLYVLKRLAADLYVFSLGASILLELAVHVRLVPSFFLYRSIDTTNTFRGRIQYSRRLTLELSSLDMLLFAALFTLLFGYTQSLFVLGGVFGCLLASVQQWNRARQNVVAHKIEAPSGSPS